MASSTTDALFQDQPDDADFDEPAPPSQAELNLEYSVGDILKHLTQVINGENVAWALNHTLSCLRSHVHDCKGLRPSREDCEQMLSAMTHALVGAVEHLSGNYSRAQIRLGMNAASGLIIYWAETDAERAERHPHALSDLLDYTAMLRNDTRNMTLLEDIQERAMRRRGDMLTELHTAFSSGGAA